MEFLVTLGQDVEIRIGAKHGARAQATVRISNVAQRACASRAGVSVRRLGSDVRADRPLIDSASGAQSPKSPQDLRRNKKRQRSRGLRH
jgi:hypothetical protein